MWIIHRARALQSLFASLIMLASLLLVTIAAVPSAAAHHEQTRDTNVAQGHSRPHLDKPKRMSRHQINAALTRQMLRVFRELKDPKPEQLVIFKLYKNGHQIQKPLWGFTALDDDGGLESCAGGGWDNCRTCKYFAPASCGLVYDECDILGGVIVWWNNAEDSSFSVACMVDLEETG